MNILITGASRGIGYELVKTFTRNGAENIIAISRNSDKLNELEKECSDIGNSKIIAIPTDLNEEGNITEIINTLRNNNIDHIDYLINNAGALVNSDFENTTAEQLLYTYNINVFAPYFLIQKLIPVLKKSQKGHVINISSMGGYQGSAKFPGLTAYSSSKAAIANLTECLAEEYKNSTVRFNCLALGAVNTEMLQEAFPGYKAPVSSSEMADYIYNFALNGYGLFNGKILPVSSSTP